MKEICVLSPMGTYLGTVKRVLHSRNGCELFIVLNGLKYYVWQTYGTHEYVVYPCQRSESLDLSTLRGFVKQ